MIQLSSGPASSRLGNEKMCWSISSFGWENKTYFLDTPKKKRKILRLITCAEGVDGWGFGFTANR